jgi:hypothetical protein
MTQISRAFIGLAAAGVASLAVLAGARTAGAQEPPADPCAGLGGDLELAAVQEQQPLCAIGVEKTLVTEGTVNVAETVTFQIVVTNTGVFPLDDVMLVDEYDPAVLDFVGASVAPSDADEAVGIITWEELLPDPDSGVSGLWDAGESRTIALNFTALDATVTENCAIALAFVAFEVVVQQSQEGLSVESDLVCAEVSIEEATPTATATRTSGGGSRRDPTSTATQPPLSTPTPVSTVAAATSVPPTPGTGVVIAAPDTGSGPTHVPTSGTALFAIGAALAAAIAGFALIRRATR